MLLVTLHHWNLPIFSLMGKLRLIELWNLAQGHLIWSPWNRTHLILEYAIVGHEARYFAE